MLPWETEIVTDSGLWKRESEHLLLRFSRGSCFAKGGYVEVAGVRFLVSWALLIIRENQGSILY